MNSETSQPGEEILEAAEIRIGSPDDQLGILLRLTEQVAEIAEQLDRLRAAISDSQREDSSASAFPFETTKLDESEERLTRLARPPLPDPRLLRRIIRQRQLRGRFFHGDLFADPAWDMLLDLAAARAEHRRVSVTSLCIASGVPPTTALRWISQLTQEGLLERIEDDTDRRRAFIILTDRAADAISRYFAALAPDAMRLI